PVRVVPLHGVCRHHPDGHHAINQGYDMKPYSQWHAGSAAEPGLLRAISGLIIWSISFLTLYVAHAQGCQLMSPGTSGWLKTCLLVLWALPLIVLGTMLASSRRRLHRARRLREPGKPS